MNVMLLAAGEGTRLQPHTAILPKPAIPFLNVPLACYSLAFLEQLKIDHLVVNTYHLPEKIHALLNKIDHRAKKVCFSDEGQILLGSGGGLKFAEKYFDQADFILMNGDEVILPKRAGQLDQALEQHRKSGAICTLLTMEHPEVGSRFGGVWLNAQEKVIAFGKDKPANAIKGLHFIGVQILSKKIFQYLPPGVSNVLYDGVAQALAANETVQTFSYDCHWFETGNPTDFVKATGECLKIMALGQTPEAQYLKTVLSRFSPTSQLSVINNKMILAAAGSQPGDFSGLLGWLVLGHGAKVSSGCHLRNIILNENVTLPENTQAENKLFCK